MDIERERKAGNETFYAKLTGLDVKTENVAAEEQEYDNKHNFKELLDTAKPEKPEAEAETDETKEEEDKLKEISENENSDEDDKDDEDNSGSDEEGVSKKETYNLSGMTKEEKKAHKTRIKEENREKRKNKMKKYDKNR